MAKMLTTAHNLEINPSHFIIKNLNQVRKSDPELAKEVLEQVCMSAFIKRGGEFVSLTDYDIVYDCQIGNGGRWGSVQMMIKRLVSLVQ